MAHKSATYMAVFSLFIAQLVLESASAQTVGSAASSTSAVIDMTMTMPAAASNASEARMNETGSVFGRTGGEVAALEVLQAQGKVVALRSSTAGSYEARLLFCSDGPRYYVALLERSSFWRVIATQNERRASAAYVKFSKIASQLSEVEVNSLRIEAQTNTVQRKTAEMQARMEGMKADLAIAKAQEQYVAESQKDIKNRIKVVRELQRAQNDQLISLNRSIADTQRQLDASSLWSVVSSSDSR